MVPRIFISYARADLDFVTTLHDRLEKAGCIAWYDQEQMPGIHWTTQLMDWIEQADAIVVIVSPHSVQSKSVQNEVLIAQQQRKVLLPVLLEDPDPRGELWLLISCIQWIDARQQRDPLLKLVQAMQSCVTGYAPPTPLPPPTPTFPFQGMVDDLIADKTDGFVGRSYVFRAIEEFLTRHPKGYFTIEADPGAGKSALLAQYVAQHTACLAHFNVRASGVNNPAHFLERMCTLLIYYYNLPYRELPPQATRDGAVLATLLKEASAKCPSQAAIVMAIDALDEVDQDNMSTGTNILYLPPTLPEGVFIVMTRRRMDRLSFRVNPGVPMETFDLMRYHAESRQDVQEYIRLALDKRPELRTWIDRHDMTVDSFVELLSDKSENNFMYLRYIVPEIERGVYQNLEMAAIPQGLSDYYKDHWQRMRQRAGDDNWFRYKLPIIVALTETKEPISIDLIADFSGIKERARISAVLQEWTAFLQADQSFFHDTLVNRYRIYHSSFHDFMSEQEEVIEERKNVQRRTIDELWNEPY